MCGIAGFIDPRTPDPGYTCAAMAQALVHRGPDDSGCFLQREAGVGLAHRRLAIVDLSPTGHQPMRSASGRYVIVYNGEIYNHAAVRQQLKEHGAPPAWRGSSDTETLLAAIEAWGIAPALQRCVGMFALAIWDQELRRLTLARDRLGEKPLYYGHSGSAFLFGSELKALRVHPAFHGEIDRDCLALYLRYCYVPEPYCIYRGYFRLPPGTLLEVDEHGRCGAPVAYWNAAALVDVPVAGRFTEIGRAS